MKNIIFITRNITIIIIIIFITILIPSHKARALTMSSSDYNLQMEKFNTQEEIPENSEVKADSTYTVYSGFPYTDSITKFRFSISETFIDFGVIDPGIPVSRTNSLTVYPGKAFSYSVYASQNNPLTAAEGGNIIPNTTCDDGNCTENSSSEWISSLTYGFGYRCDNQEGTNCPPSFNTATFYKHFADSSKNQTEQEVMSGANIGKYRRSKITYKVNIQATQPAGLYNNIVRYIAAPAF